MRVMVWVIRLRLNDMASASVRHPHAVVLRLRQPDEHFVLVDADPERVPQLVVETVGQQGVAHEKGSPRPLL